MHGRQTTTKLRQKFCNFYHVLFLQWIYHVIKVDQAVESNYSSCDLKAA